MPFLFHSLSVSSPDMLTQLRIEQIDTHLHVGEVLLQHLDGALAALGDHVHAHGVAGRRLEPQIRQPPRQHHLVRANER